MKYRTVWISDLHLGARGCNAEGLLDFLRAVECETLYLVGDVVDLWSLKREHYWPQTHNDVVQKILRKARKGTRVIYIPGNHDEFGCRFFGVYGNVWIKSRDLYVTGRGQRLLILHGHEFDTVTQHAQWLATLGDIGYEALLNLNRPLNALRRMLGRDHWSLSAYVKSRVKNAVSFISQFEHAVSRYAEMYAVDGIVCGHIHTPVIKRIRDVAYYNCGDWVENSTLLVEDYAGRLNLIRWREAAMPVAAEVMTHGPLIVIAEDEPDTASLLAYRLQKCGVESVATPDGISALNAVFERKPDLVILDLMMPRMDGLEVCRLLKSSPITRKIPVLLLSALASPTDKLKGFGSGADDYLTKPFEMSELVARIFALLRRADRTEVPVP